jgi:hypothetical protein
MRVRVGGRFVGTRRGARGVRTVTESETTCGTGTTTARAGGASATVFAEAGTAVDWCALAESDCVPTVATPPATAVTPRSAARRPAVLNR